MPFALVTAILVSASSASNSTAPSIVYVLVDVTSSFVLSMLARFGLPPTDILLRRGWTPRRSFSSATLIDSYLPHGIFLMNLYYITGMVRAEKAADGAGGGEGGDGGGAGAGGAAADAKKSGGPPPLPAGVDEGRADSKLAVWAPAPHGEVTASMR